MNLMGNEVERSKNDLLRRFPRRNYMAFPRELRSAIPEGHAGRVLELDSVAGQAAASLLPLGAFVQLKLLVKETGKLTGEFVVRMDLQPDAARKLAAELTRLADEADRLPRV